MFFGGAGTVQIFFSPAAFGDEGTGRKIFACLFRATVEAAGYVFVVGALQHFFKIVLTQKPGKGGAPMVGCVVVAKKERALGNTVYGLYNGFLAVLFQQVVHAVKDDRVQAGELFQPQPVPGFHYAAAGRGQLGQQDQPVALLDLF